MGAPADDADEDETCNDGSEQAQAAMADLFVAADRLHHDPRNEFFVEEVAQAAAVVASTRAPYGVEGAMWSRLQELAAAVLSVAEDGVDEDGVAAEARALRDFLASYV